MSCTKNLIKIYATLPTERYLKKFLENKVSVSPEYVVSNKDTFGSFVYVCLENGNYNVELNQKKLNDKIKLVIPIDYENRKKKDLTSENIHLINNFLKSWFYEDFFTYMLAFDTFSVPHDKSIYNFCNRYNIELDVDVNFETLKKAYYRYREKKGQPMHTYLIELLENN